MIQKYFIMIVCIILLIMLIWYNSLQNETSSDGLSLWVTSYMIPILHSIGIHGDIWILNKIVRKIAHVVEFAVLGVFLYGVGVAFNKTNVAIKVVCIGASIAVCDELLQLFSIGRHASIKDVFIDTMGVIIGIVLARVGQFTYNNINKK